MKKTVLKGMALGLALTAAAPMAAMAGEGAANVTLTSNYLWRGITQTTDGAALQGGYDYDFGNGFSLGTWASNVTPGIEYDIYGAYEGKSGDMGYSVGFIYYGYTDASLAAFTEPYVGLSYKDASMNYYIGDGYSYTELSYGTAVSGVDLGLTYGINTPTVGSGTTHLILSAGKDVGGYGVSLTYSDVSSVTGIALGVTKEF